MASRFFLHRAGLFAGFLFLFFMVVTDPVAAATELGSGVEMLGGPELTPSSTLEFRFVESMIPSDNLGPSSQPPVVFSPELAGTFTWLSTRSGVFVPTGPLPLGTSWQLQLRPGLNSVSGKKIPSSSPVELFTPAFALTASRSGAWNEKDIASNIQPALAFNAAVDLESAKKSLRFEDASGRTIPSEVRFATSSDYFPLTPEQGDWADRWNQTLDPSGSPSETGSGAKTERPNLLFVTPAHPLPPGEGWKLLGGSGIRSADQKHSITRPIDLKLGTVQPLLLLGVDADNFINSGTAANIRFNLPLAPDITADTAPRFFQVQPEPQNLTYQVDWQGMMIRGDFELGTEYQLQVGEGVIGNDGRPFAGTREVSFRFNAVAPRVYLPEITGQQLQFGRREFPVRSINLSGMNLRAIQVSPQNVPAALKAFSKYQKTEWDETNQEEVYQPLETGAITGKSIFDGPVKTPPANVDEALEFPIRWNELLGEEASGAVFLTLEGAPIPGIPGKQAGAQAFVQITDLGLLWKKDRAGLHVMVFSMKTGQPVAGCKVAILDENLSPLNSGSTPKTGRVRLAFEGSPAWLSVQNDGDSHVIPMGNAASELPVWSFRIPAIYPPWEDDVQKEGLLRGILFTDRPLYQAGETVSVKGILRMLSQNDISFPGELTGQLILFGPRGEKLETRVITAGPNGNFDTSSGNFDTSSGNFDTSSGNFDTTFTAPSLQRGEYRLGFHQGTEPFEWWQAPIHTTFLVADYQPDAFEITLDTPGSVPAGQPAPALKVSGNYFFGGPLSDAKLQWTLQSSRQDFSPPGFPDFKFLPNPPEGPGAAKTTSGEMDWASGETPKISPEWGEIHSAPMREILTVEVTDLNQQTVVQERTFTRDTSDFYLGIAPWEQFVFRAGQPLEVRVVAVAPDGNPMPDPVTIQAELIYQRNDVVRLQGAGNAVSFQTTTTEESAGEKSGLTSIPSRSGDNWIAEGEPAAVFTPERTGSYILRVTSKDSGGRKVMTERMLYVAGADEAVWSYRNPSQIDLIPDRPKYKPGETARVLLKSPIDGLAIITIERGDAIEKVWTQQITGNAPVLDVPIEAKYAPNAFVSVVILRGAEASKRKYPEPEFRHGICQLTIQDPADELEVKILPAVPTVQPGDTVQTKISVRRSDGTPASGASVTFFAVDDGVLALTDYQRPDPLKIFQAALPLGVRTGLTLQGLMPENPDALEFSNKGYLIGGGGVSGAGLKFREDFPGTICWMPALTANEAGEIEVQFTAPDTLTRYRLIAVAQEGTRRFGSGESSFTIEKPLMLLSGLGAFAREGDSLVARVIARNQTGAAGTVQIRMDLPEGVEAKNGTELSAPLENGASKAFDIPLQFSRTGSVRIAWSASMQNGEAQFADALAVTIDVSSPMVELRETYLPDLSAKQTDLLEGVNPQLQEGSGKVLISVANSRLVGIGESATYLTEYPYGCLEQTVSALIPWLSRGLAPLLPGLSENPEKSAGVIQEGVVRIFSMQTESGGLSFWPGGTSPSLPISAWAAIALSYVPATGETVPEGPKNALLDYLSRSLREELPATNPSAMTDRAMVLYALALHGRPEPAYAEALLAQAGRLTNEARSLMALSLAMEDGDENRKAALGLVSTPSAAEESFDRFGSIARAQSLRLLALTTITPTSKSIPPMVAELLTLRQNGHWGNTQANAWAMLAFQSYYTQVESAGGKAAKSVRGEILHNGISSAFSLSSTLPAFETRTDWEGGNSGEKLAVLNPSALPLYGQTTFRVNPPLGTQPRQDRGFSVSRSYQKLEADGTAGPADNLKIGDRVLVTLRIETSRPGVLVAVEDPLPAVLEPVNPDFKSRGENKAGEENFHFAQVDFRETRSDRVMFFSDQLPAGTNLYQHLTRVRCAGESLAPAPKAEEMYRPERFGIGEIQTLRAAAE